jgi:hypothetical protein
MAEILEQYFTKEDLGGGRGEDGIITHLEKSIIVFDEVVPDTQQALLDSGFEAGQRHRDNDFLYLNGSVDANPHPNGNGTIWLFNLEYTTKAFNSPNTTDPESQRPEIKFNSWTYNTIVESDKETNQAILNTAGDPYDPQPEETITCPVVKITLRENSPKIERFEDVGSINQSQISIAGITFPKYCAMFARYETEPSVDEAGFTTHLNTYTIYGNYKTNKSGDKIGFKLELLSQGFNEIKEGEKAEIKVAGGFDENNNPIDPQPVAQPQMLDESGAVTTEPFYQEFVVHNLIDFSRLGLPSSYQA